MNGADGAMPSSGGAATMSWVFKTMGKKDNTRQMPIQRAVLTLASEMTKENQSKYRKQASYAGARQS